MIVTGAGSGTGRATARLFAAHDVRVALADINGNGPGQPPRALRRRSAAVTAVGNLSDQEVVDRAVTTAVWVSLAVVNQE
ncbi:SDR family NAD(P)-dependent oxidoreductase [Streptomyces sp. B1-3]|uniref:SDR family NAD(P)-dependent oxidoreductase n=1 Tax=Streptomyces sp. B1-3 TaxID=3141453 RepID=UPI003D27D4B4